MFQFSAWRKATSDGKLLFGKNMDNLDLPGVAEGRILVFCDLENGLGHVNVTQAGMLAIDGGFNLYRFNEAGVGMMTHYSGSKCETMRGCGIGSLSRLVLQRASSVEDAIEILTVYPRCTGINSHVADAKVNRAVVIEANAKETAVRSPFQRDVLWSTNHCNCYPGWMGYQGRNMVEGQMPVYRLKDIGTIKAWQLSLREKGNPNIAASGRFRRYEKLLDENYGSLSLMKGIEILRDRHHPETNELRDWDTPAKARNDGVTISYLLPRKVFSEKALFYKSEDEGPITGQSTNLWSMMATPASGDVHVAVEGLPAHRGAFTSFNFLKELGRLCGANT
ncbi:MAG: carcinine hydrolase/isopenicillin-N N-acyltransferase family protein [Spirochaetes bacterium]|nr:carcinine hydrolase/isopenicillin-N N-acyltransferase family protein [Spirochaetota bacterium]